MTGSQGRKVFKLGLTYLEHTSKPIRQSALGILKQIYQICHENFSELKDKFFSSLRQVHINELEKAFDSLQKSTSQEKLVYISTVASDDPITTHIQGQGQNKKGAIAAKQEVDLHSVLPEMFDKQPYTFQNTTKKDVLYELANILTGLLNKSVKLDASKDYTQMFNIITQSIEEQHFQVSNEAIKCLGMLVKLFKHDFPSSKVKYMLLLLTEKFKGGNGNGKAAGKYWQNESLWQILSDMLSYNSPISDTFLDIMLNQMECSRSQTVRVGCATWLSSHFIEALCQLQISSQSYSLKTISSQELVLTPNVQQIQALLDRLFKTARARVTALLKKDNQSQQIRRLCETLLSDTFSSQSQRSIIQTMSQQQQQYKQDCSNDKENQQCFSNTLPCKLSGVKQNLHEKINKVNNSSEKDQNIKKKKKKHTKFELEVEESPQSKISTPRMSITELMNNNTNTKNNCKMNASVRTLQIMEQSEEDSSLRDSNSNSSNLNQSQLQTTLLSQFQAIARHLQTHLSANSSNNTNVKHDPTNQHRIDAFLQMLDDASITQLPDLQSIQSSLVQSLYSLAKKTNKMHFYNANSSSNMLNNYSNLNMNMNTMEQMCSFCCEAFCRLNRTCVELPKKSLLKELSVLLLCFGGVLKRGAFQRVLQSAFMTCGLDSFLQVTLSLFNKINKENSKDCNSMLAVSQFQMDSTINNLRLLALWLVRQIEGLQACLLKEQELSNQLEEYSRFVFLSPQLQGQRIQNIIHEAIFMKLKIMQMAQAPKEDQLQLHKATMMQLKNDSLQSQQSQSSMMHYHNQNSNSNFNQNHIRNHSLSCERKLNKQMKLQYSPLSQHSHSHSHSRSASKNNSSLHQQQLHNSQQKPKLNAQELPQLQQLQQNSNPTITANNKLTQLLYSPEHNSLSCIINNSPSPNRHWRKNIGRESQNQSNNNNNNNNNNVMNNTNNIEINDTNDNNENDGMNAQSGKNDKRNEMQTQIGNNNVKYINFADVSSIVQHICNKYGQQNCMNQQSQQDQHDPSQVFAELKTHLSDEGMAQFLQLFFSSPACLTQHEQKQQQPLQALICSLLGGIKREVVLSAYKMAFKQIKQEQQRELYCEQLIRNVYLQHIHLLIYAYNGSFNELKMQLNEVHFLIDTIIFLCDSKSTELKDIGYGLLKDLHASHSYHELNEVFEKEMQLNTSHEYQVYLACTSQYLFKEEANQQNEFLLQHSQTTIPRNLQQQSTRLQASPFITMSPGDDHLSLCKLVSNLNGYNNSFIQSTNANTNNFNLNINQFKAEATHSSNSNYTALNQNYMNSNKLSLNDIAVAQVKCTKQIDLDLLDFGTEQLLEEPAKFKQHANINMNSKEAEWKAKFEEEQNKHRQTLELLQKVNLEYLREVAEKETCIQQVAKEKKLNSQLLSDIQIINQENKNLHTELQQCQLKIKCDLQSSLIQSSSQQPTPATKLEQDSIQLQFQQNQSENIKRLQQVLLTSDSFENLQETMLKHFDSLVEIKDKATFINELKEAILGDRFLDNISDTNHKTVLAIVLRLCVSCSANNNTNNSKSNTNLQLFTGDLQTMLDALLASKNVTVTIINLIQILSLEMPINFTSEFNSEQQLMYRLLIKCIERIQQQQTLDSQCTDFKLFEVLLALYKFFKAHPPEELQDNQPCIKDLEFIFRSLKKICDDLILLQPNKCEEFLSIYKTNTENGIFLNYLSAQNNINMNHYTNNSSILSTSGEDQHNNK